MCFIYARTPLVLIVVLTALHGEHITNVNTMPVYRKTAEHLFGVGHGAERFLINELNAKRYLRTFRPSARHVYQSLRAYQNDNDLPATGRFDQKTQESMHEYKCGDKGISSTSKDEFDDYDYIDDYQLRFKREINEYSDNVTYSNNSTVDEANLEQEIGKSKRAADPYDNSRWWFICDLLWETKNQEDTQHTVSYLETRALFRSALRTWLRAVNYNRRKSILTITENRNSGRKADVSISFKQRIHGDGNPFDGKGKVLAHAFLPFISGKWDGELHLDNEEDWDLQTLEGRLMSYVILHETGHLFGLKHSKDFNAVMYPYIGRRHAGLRSLRNDDIQKIRDKYPIRWCDNPDRVPFAPRYQDRLRINRGYYRKK
ncbi:PREDICTED: metalloendoproteinase 1-like [Priapulus caudatus]|uniref:Metalloendoproteinase 1-like n=1 Tax=Priapulus caudatus TaxID=37621 RepID=A0ABM1EHZ9_PRICU|nr:PREDICTED: metalloendoproteinase 1-like [Priapulus caudatus]